MKYDVESRGAPPQLIDPDTLTGNGDATLSAAVDLAGYDGCLLIASIGESGDTLGAALHIQCEVQDSDDDSTYAAVADAKLTNTVTGSATGTFCKVDAAAEDDAAFMTQYNGAKRYVKVNVNRTGNHATGTPMSIVAIKLNYKYPPV